VILTAGYMLWTIQRVFFGPEKPEYKNFPEVNGREITVLAPLAVMAILLGILPTVFFFVFTSSTVDGLFKLFNGASMVSMLGQ
jgi:NADH-quinone oxidoreductase subunit M